MTTRSVRVEFLAEESTAEVTSDPEVHDISIPDGVAGTPQILENPHVDFPGTWALVDEGVDGTARYRRAALVADTSDTAAG